MQPYNLHFTIPGLPRTPNALLGAHWKVRAGHAAKWKRLVFLAINNKQPKRPLVKAKLTLTRHSSGELDFAGLCGSFKAIEDALVMWGVIVDDCPDVVGRPEYLHVKAPRQKGFIEVLVEEINKQTEAI